MRLNRKGRLARFYRVTGTGSLPDDLCTLFWGLVFRLGVITVVFVGTIVFIVAMAQLMWQYKLGSIFFIFGLLVGYLLVFWLPRRHTPELFQETYKVISGKIHSVKYRYCPHIDWTDPKP